jgi:NADH dehydrogenase/NADH:ubiquinone oxidoreductase subunit G
MTTCILTIDNRKVEVLAGSTILEAARQAGIDIPTLCDDPLLNPFGACRLCIVEVEGYRGLPTACSTPVADGMQVRTSSPVIEANRRTTMNLLLSDHPLECLHCVKNTRCDLQNVAAYVGVREQPYKGERRAYDVDESNPFYGRDLEKCILCGKCVRACDELQGRQAIHFGYRGFATKITTPYDLLILRGGLRPDSRNAPRRHHRCARRSRQHRQCRAHLCQRPLRLGIRAASRSREETARPKIFAGRAAEADRGQARAAG